MKEYKTNQFAKQTVIETVQYFKENPKRWICQDFCKVPNNGNKPKACLTGQMAIDLGLPPKFVEKYTDIQNGDVILDYIAEKLSVGKKWVRGLIDVNDEAYSVNELAAFADVYLKKKRVPERNFENEIKYENLKTRFPLGCLCC